MRNESLTASVNYGDYQGTAAADRHDTADLHKLAKRYGIDTARYFIIGARLHIAENRDIELGHGSVTLLAVDTKTVKAYGVDAINNWIRHNGGSLPYVEFDIDATLKQFLMAFKRLEIVFVNSHIDGVQKYKLMLD